MLLLEFGDGQEKSLQNIFEQDHAWDKIRLLEDNTGRPRVIMACKNKFPLPTKDKRHG
jgi:methylase of polypeptide subunit release factors